MTTRHRDLTAGQREVQAALDRSWAHAQEALSNPTFRAELEASIERVNRSTAQPMAKAEFLAFPEPPSIEGAAPRRRAASGG